MPCEFRREDPLSPRCLCSWVTVLSQWCASLPSSKQEPLASPCVPQGRTAWWPLNSIFPPVLLLYYFSCPQMLPHSSSLQYPLFFLHRVREWWCDSEGAHLRGGYRELCASHVALSYWRTPTVSFLPHHLKFRAHRVKDHVEDCTENCSSALDGLSHGLMFCLSYSSSFQLYSSSFFCLHQSLDSSPIFVFSCP